MFLVHKLLQLLMFVGKDAIYCIGTFPPQDILVNTRDRNFTAFFSLGLLDGHISTVGYRTLRRHHLFRSPCNHSATVSTTISPGRDAKSKNHKENNEEGGKHEVTS